MGVAWMLLGAWLALPGAGLRSAGGPAASAQSIRLSRPDSAAVEVGPSGLAACPVRVRVEPARTCRLTDRLELPEGWRRVDVEAPFEVRAGRTVTRLLVVLPPRSALPGRYVLRYDCRDARHPATGAELEIPVRVAPDVKLELSLLEGPPRTIAGAEYAARFRLDNPGNAPLAVSLEASDAHGWPAEFGPGLRFLAPYAADTLVVRVQTDPAITSGLVDRLVVEARAEQAGLPADAAPSAGGGVRAAATAVTLVHPGVQARGAVWRRVPATFTLRQIDTEGADGWQAELRGSGPIDRSGRERLSFCLRGPERTRGNPFGLRPEYGAAIDGGAVTLAAGHQRFVLSPLLESGQEGLGLRAGVRTGPVEIGAYASRNRAEAPRSRQAAATLTVHPVPEVSLEWRSLSREARSGRRLLHSAGAELRRGRVALELEGGAGERLDRRERIAFAGRGRLVIGTGHARLFVDGIRAGRGFAGEHQDLALGNAVAAWSPQPYLRTALSGRLSRHNPSGRRDGGPALRETEVRSSIAWAVRRAWTGELELEDLRRSDALSPASLDWREHAVAGRIRRIDGVLQGGVGYRQAVCFDEAPPGEPLRHDAWRWHAEASLHPVRWLRVGGEAQGGHFGQGPGTRPSRAFGLEGALEPSPGARVAARWRRVERPSLSAGDHLGVSGELPIWRGHRAVLRFERRQYASRRLADVTAWQAGYEIPLTLPIRPDDRFGRVRGRVHDAEASSRSGIPGVWLQLGHLGAVTDENGEFCFAGVKPGEYCLEVNRADLGLERVPVLPFPQSVQVPEGKETRVAIAVARAARLEGCVRLRAPAARPEKVAEPAGGGAPGGGTSASPADSTGLTSWYSPDQLSCEEADRWLDGMTLEFRQGSTVVLATADAAGRFWLDDLSPGTWTLETRSASLPPHWRFARQDLSVRLGPGESARLDLELEPQPRRVRIVDRGSIRLISSGEPIR